MKIKVLRSRSRNKKNNRTLRPKGFQLALSFRDICNSFPNTKTEIVVTEGDGEGGRVDAIIREIGASTLVLGLHGHSFLYKHTMNKEGDWLCPACQHLNFKKRDPCQRCICPKNASAAEASSYSIQRTELMPGDWYCGGLNCSAHNYASRTSCYRCGALKDYCGYGAGMIASAGYAYDAIPGWKSGDWICTRFVSRKQGINACFP